MDAEFAGFVENLVGVFVVDDDEHLHEVSIDDEYGTVTGHTTDAYPADLDARTPVETERIRQVQRYAKHFFAEETTCEPYRPHDRPDRIAGVREAVAAMDPEAFAAEFGTYRAQLASHFDRSDRPHPLPDGVGDPDGVLYRVGVFLDDGAVDRVSDVAVVYWAPYDERRRVRLGPERPGDPTAGADAAPTGRADVGPSPDARLELGPADLSGDQVGRPEAFRETVTRHLACQIRDYYVGMAVDPPEPYRVAGPGKRAYTSRYRTLGLYPDYHDPSTDPFAD